MSTNNYILNLLNIKDENIHIITKYKEKSISTNKLQSKIPNCNISY